MSEPFLGEIKLFGFSFAPRGYALCDGQTLPIAQYSALFSLLGTYYGGNGQTTFQLPDLQGRTPVHAGPQTPVGSIDGVESVTLTISEMPAHNHGLTATSATADKRPPNGHTFANDTSATTNFFANPSNLTPLAQQSIGNTGGGTPHENMQPFLVMNYCIALNGIFPSRN